MEEVIELLREQAKKDLDRFMFKNKKLIDALARS